MLRKKALKGMEQLENKVLLTCDVDFDGEKLEIKCDDDADVIFVAEDGAGDLLVDAGDGLDNLGSADDLKDIVVESEGGDDVVFIVQLTLSDSIEVKSGEGDDTVAVGDNLTIGNDLKIETDKGRDEVFIGAGLDVGNTVDIKLGGGRDAVNADFSPGTTAGNDIKIDGEGSRDKLFGEGQLHAGNELELKSITSV